MIKASFWLAASLAMGATLLTGCSANYHSIHRMRTLPGAQATLTLIDAKQRAIITTSVDGRLRACLEESPDFASVIAQSLSATGSFGQSAEPASVQAAASLAASTSEQGSTISRTQAVNLMRALLTSDCWQYFDADRSTRELAMPIQAVRTQRIITSLMGIDGITAMAPPAPVIIGAGGSASAGSSSAEAVVRLDNAQQALATADAAQRTRQTAYDTLQGASPSCTAIEQKATATPPQTLTADETTKRTQCANALSALNTAKASRQRASEDYETLRSAMASGGGGPASATATVQQGDHAVAVAARAHSEATARVAQAVEHIVDQAYAQDEFGLFCLRFIDPRNPVDPTLRDACIAYLSANLHREAARAEAQARQYRLDFDTTLPRIVERDDQFFDLFWARVAPASTLDRARLAAAVDSYIASVTNGGWGPSDLAELQQLKAVTNRDSARAIFATLSDRSREALGRREN